MTEPTDKTIEIKCYECAENHIEHWETGSQAMFEHILAEHPSYNHHEADYFARQWMEDAYDEIDAQNQKLTEAYQHEKQHRNFWGKR